MSNTREWAAMTPRTSRCRSPTGRSRGQPHADLPGRERPLGRQEREDLRGRRREPLLGPGDAASANMASASAAGPGPRRPSRRGGPARGLVPGPTACGASRGGGSGSARRERALDGRHRRVGHARGRRQVDRHRVGGVQRDEPSAMATTSSVCVAATCRWRTASGRGAGGVDEAGGHDRRACRPRRPDQHARHDREPVIRGGRPGDDAGERARCDLGEPGVAHRHRFARLDRAAQLRRRRPGPRRARPTRAPRPARAPPCSIGARRPAPGLLYRHRQRLRSTWQ